MITEELLNDLFRDLASQYNLILDVKSKMRFNIYIIDDVPHELKADIYVRVETLGRILNRKRFDIDHPIIFKQNDKTLIKGGIWSIRIF
jgi:hypothetical protein